MNLCLLSNPVAFYQIAKFVVIPCTLAMQATFFTLNTNWKVLLSITVLLAGVGYVTIDGVSSGTVTFIGLVWAFLAVIGTALYRIWQETKQKEFKLGPTDFQASMAFWQAALGQGKMRDVVTFLGDFIIGYLMVQSGQLIFKNGY